MQYILDQLGVGTVVEHKKFGEGVIAEMEKVIEKESLAILFLLRKYSAIL